MQLIYSHSTSRLKRYFKVKTQQSNVCPVMWDIYLVDEWD